MFAYQSSDMYTSITCHELKDNTTMKSGELEALQENSDLESSEIINYGSIQSMEWKFVETAHGSTDRKTSMQSDGSVDSTSTESDELEDSTSIKSDESNSKPRIVRKPYSELHRAAIKGDWKTIKSFMEKDPNAKTAYITGKNETVLHVTAWMGHTRIMQELLKILHSEDLEIQSADGDTVLHIAAIGGNMGIVKALVEKNPKLTQINRPSDGRTPLLLAACYASKEVVRYLSVKTNDDAPGKPFTGPKSASLIIALVDSKMYDVAFTLLQRYPKMATAYNSGKVGLLCTLAMSPLDFLSGTNLSFWELWVYHALPVKIHNNVTHDLRRNDEEAALPRSFDNRKWQRLKGQVSTLIMELPWKALKQLVPTIKRIEQEKLKHMDIAKLLHHTCQVISNLEEDEIHTFFQEDDFLKYVAENGIVEIVTICCEYFPDLFQWEDKCNETMFQIAIKYRREKIFNILYEKTAMTKVITTIVDEDGGTLLHQVAKLAPYPQLQSIPCPALQMQREIQWFKGVEFIAQPYKRGWLNHDGKTADELFTDEHKRLVKEAEKWIKDTSNSCMLVATLIATVVFAAAFTVPGGNLEGKGTPIFLKEDIFKVFVVSDALAMFSSTTSILMFLSNLTARYAEHDFLHALPKRLIIGLASLFLAIAAMMVSFGSALYIMLSERWEWYYIPIVVLGCVPVTLFIMLQLPLFVQMVWSTYGPSIFRPQKIW